jgi:hypothetical protein
MHSFSLVTEIYALKYKLPIKYAISFLLSGKYLLFKIDFICTQKIQNEGYYGRLGRKRNSPSHPIAVDLRVEL